MAASPSLQQTGQRIEILLQNIMEKKDKLLPNASQEDHPGNCRPWNKNDFIKRVATFKIVTWFAKPVEVSPLECARYGWENTERDTLFCQVCRSFQSFVEVSVSTTSSFAPSREKQLHVYAQWKENLKLKHAETCPWRDNTSPKEFSQAPDGQSAVSAFLARLGTLAQEKAFFRPCLAKHFCSALADKPTIIEGLKFAMHQKSSSAYCHVLNVGFSNYNTLKIALIVAFFGWRAQHNDSTTYLSCEICQRELLILSDLDSSCTQDFAAHDFSDLRLSSACDKFSFDPLKEHRWFCPWSTWSCSEALAACVTAQSCKSPFKFDLTTATSESIPLLGPVQRLLNKQ